MLRIYTNKVYSSFFRVDLLTNAHAHCTHIKWCKERVGIFLSILLLLKRLKKIDRTQMLQGLQHR